MARFQKGTIDHVRAFLETPKGRKFRQERNSTLDQVMSNAVIDRKKGFTVERNYDELRRLFVATDKVCTFTRLISVESGLPYAAVFGEVRGGGIRVSVLFDPKNEVDVRVEAINDPKRTEEDEADEIFNLADGWNIIDMMLQPISSPDRVRVVKI